MGETEKCKVCAAAEERKAKRFYLRRGDYYGGDLWISGMPEFEYDIVEVRLGWEGYQGGGAEIALQSEQELEKLGDILLTWAKILKGEAENG